MKKSIESYYDSIGVLDKKLIESCPNTLPCWSRIPESRKIDADWGIYLPYIGNKYTTGRIMVIGINMNGMGDKGAADILAMEAKQDILKGKKETFANPGYRGSLLWHRLLSYSAFILREIGILTLPKERPYPEKEELAEAIDYVAVTNSIKCSPTTENSKPSNQMWVNCPELILRQEIKVLDPKYIVVLGKENFYYLISLFSNINYVHDEEVKLIEATFEDRDITVFCLPHPAFPKGAAKKRMDELEVILMQYYNHSL